MRLISVFFCLMPIAQALFAQNNSSGYIVRQENLPESLQNQVCISGIVYNKGKLLMASERCPLLFELDTAITSLAKTIETGISGTYETEGIAIFNSYKLLVSENLAIVYCLDSAGNLNTVNTSPALPAKLKSGDGMEGITANEMDKIVYLLRERNESGSNAQVFTYKVEDVNATLSLMLLATTDIPLENQDWRYSDICFDRENRQLLCLKSYSKGKARKHKIDALLLEPDGRIKAGSLKTIVNEGFSNISANDSKRDKNSLNFEGLAIDEAGNMYVVSDNTSGAAKCGQVSKEKTVLLKLLKIK